MATYLLTWNPKKGWEWIPDPDLADDEFEINDLAELVDSFNHGEIYKMDWSCGNRKQMDEGDCVWFLRQAEEPRGIFGYGTVLIPPFEHERWLAQWVIFRIDSIVNPKSDPIVPRERLNDPPFKSVHWDTQRSGIGIPDDVATALQKEWSRMVKMVDLGLDLVTPDGSVAGSYTISVPAAKEERLRAELATHPEAEYGVLDGYADLLGSHLDLEDWEGGTWRPRQKTEDRESDRQEGKGLRESGPAEESPEDGVGEDDSTLSEEIPDTCFEGARQTVTINRYERSSRARKECIEEHGARCFVCGFAFAEKYGPACDGLIHVHHLVPLSEIGEGYELDPIEDLRPVCPNCHAIIHANVPHFSIKDVKGMIAT